MNSLPTDLLLPHGVDTRARPVLLARSLRALADGYMAVLLPAYLLALGLGTLEVGLLSTATMLGSAAATLAVGAWGHRAGSGVLLRAAALLMCATGVGFALLGSFGPLLVVATVGTLNPSSGDVSVFLPLEHARLAGAAAGRARTALFARYSVLGALCAALGALAAGLPDALVRGAGLARLDALRAMFVVYALLGLAVFALYRRTPPAAAAGTPAPAPLGPSRGVVVRLAALFSVDSFGGGFVVQSLLVLWLHRRFQLDQRTTAAVFFVAGTLAALSQVLSPRVAARIGLIRTMVYTHLPANLFLIAAGVMPTAPLAIACLLLRMSVSSMDVPARQAFVMAVVPPEERAAAATVTNVPRSLAAGLAPLIAGALLQKTSFGWPLIIGGALKAIYDLALLVQFRAVAPREHGIR